MNNILKAKVIPKHGTEQYWLDSTYVPSKGETVIYDIEVDKNGGILAEATDANGSFPNNRSKPITNQRLKIGDGIHRVVNLPFVGSNCVSGTRGFKFSSQEKVEANERQYICGFSVDEDSPEEEALKSALVLLKTLMEDNTVFGSISIDVDYMDGGENKTLEECFFYNSIQIIGVDVEKQTITYQIKNNSRDGIMLYNQLKYSGTITKGQITLTGYPECGSVDLGERSSAIGNRTEALHYSAYAEGSRSRAVGSTSHAEGHQTFATTYGHTEGTNTKAYGRTGHAEGKGTEAYGFASHAEGQGTRAHGSFSHAEGSGSIAGNSDQQNNFSYNMSLKTPVAAHAEGINTQARAMGSHSEGAGTVTCDQRAFRIVDIKEIKDNKDKPIGEFWLYLNTLGDMKLGITYKASLSIDGEYKNIGYVQRRTADTIKDGIRVRLYPNEDVKEQLKVNPLVLKKDENEDVLIINPSTLEPYNYMTFDDNPDWGDIELWTRAGGFAQHVQGRFNTKDEAGKFAHIVGNGTDDSNRSNAHTLDWEGNAWFAGDVRVGSNNRKLISSNTLAEINVITIAPGETIDASEFQDGVLTIVVEV